MKWIVELKQTFQRTATIEVEADNEECATDNADNLDPQKIQWRELSETSFEILDCSPKTRHKYPPK